MSNGRVLLDSVGDVGSEVGVVACKLVPKGWKNILEFPTIEVIPGTEKTSTKNPLLGNHL